MGLDLPTRRAAEETVRPGPHGCAATRWATLSRMSLRYAILGLLTADELSGYEITSRFEHSVGYFWHARSQQIYPELGRLEGDGLVSGPAGPSDRAARQAGLHDHRVGTLATCAMGGDALALELRERRVHGEGLVLRTGSPAEAIEALGEHRARHEERLEHYRKFAPAFPSRMQHERRRMPSGRCSRSRPASPWRARSSPGAARRSWC